MYVDINHTGDRKWDQIGRDKSDRLRQKIGWQSSMGRRQGGPFIKLPRGLTAKLVSQSLIWLLSPNYSMSLALRFITVSQARVLKKYNGGLYTKILMRTI